MFDDDSRWPQTKEGMIKFVLVIVAISLIMGIVNGLFWLTGVDDHSGWICPFFFIAMVIVSFFMHWLTKPRQDSPDEADR